MYIPLYSIGIFADTRVSLFLPLVTLGMPPTLFWCPVKLVLYIIIKRRIALVSKGNPILCDKKHQVGFKYDLRKELGVNPFLLYFVYKHKGIVSILEI